LPSLFTYYFIINCEVLLLSVYCCLIFISLNISLSLAYSLKQSTIQLVSLSEDTLISLFFTIIGLWTRLWLLHYILLLVLPLHSINDTYLRHCQLKIIFRNSVSFRCTPSSWFWMRKHIQLTIDSPNLYIICILHITTHY